MKVGTDAVLLGAWCAIDTHADAVLDIGAGTGVIALMLAQRSEAMTIDAVEIEENAHEQCVENFEMSPWADRLFCYHTDFEAFVEEMEVEEERYDCIVSNPPFYTDAFETKDVSRNKARFASALSFEDLLSGVARLLSDTGVFSVIIPYKEEEVFIDLGKQHGLYVCRGCRVKGTASAPMKRSMLTFSFHNQEATFEELVIEHARHEYTADYIHLTQDFYLKM